MWCLLQSIMMDFHHDSKVSDYSAMNFVGRDLIKEFVEACRKED